MSDLPELTTERMRMQVFSEKDAYALAEVLAEPEVTRNITADCSSPEKCLESAGNRIAWHNRSWASHGYGTWAVRSADASVAPLGTLLGWCGFTEPDIGEDPEILYGLAPACWGRGLATEMARAAILWLFGNTESAGVSAVIFGEVNPASAAVTAKLGMVRRGTMAMTGFLPDPDLARAVLEYEIWRLAEGRCLDPELLLFQAPFKGGQVGSLGIRESDSVEADFVAAARAREDYAAYDSRELEIRVRDTFRRGMAESALDWHHVSRDDWVSAG